MAGSADTETTRQRGWARRKAKWRFVASSTQKPSAGTARRSSAFSSAMRSSVPKLPMCTGPTFVRIAASGRISAASGAISPGWFVPDSSTA